MDRRPNRSHNSQRRSISLLAMIGAAGLALACLNGATGAFGAEASADAATNSPASQPAKIASTDNSAVSPNNAVSPADATDVDSAGGVSGNPAGVIVIKDRQESSPLVLNQEADYILDNVRVQGVVDQAALTLAGSIRSVAIRHSRFGEALAGGNGRAAGMEALGASVRSLTVSDTVFYNCENQLVSLKEGSFGIVTFEHCVFKNSDAFLKGIYTVNPGRTTPPVAEFYNIDRLELLDNDFQNATIIIHPSVKTVVFRGDISHLQIESPDTQVLRIAPGENTTDFAQAIPADVLPRDATADPVAAQRDNRSSAAKSAAAAAS